MKPSQIHSNSETQRQIARLLEECRNLPNPVTGIKPLRGTPKRSLEDIVDKAIKCAESSSFTFHQAGRRNSVASHKRRPREQNEDNDARQTRRRSGHADEVPRETAQASAVAAQVNANGKSGSSSATSEIPQLEQDLFFLHSERAVEDGQDAATQIPAEGKQMDQHMGTIDNELALENDSLHLTRSRVPYLRNHIVRSPSASDGTSAVPQAKKKVKSGDQNEQTMSSTGIPQDTRKGDQYFDDDDDGSSSFCGEEMTFSQHHEKGDTRDGTNTGNVPVEEGEGYIEFEVPLREDY